MPDTPPISVGLHAALAPWAPEVAYTIRTWMRIAGFAHEVRWLEPGAEAAVDLYYGPAAERVRAAVTFHWSGRAFTGLDDLEPDGLDESGGSPALRFGGAGPAGADPLFGDFWLLSGARETRYPRSRFDDLDLDGSAFRRLGLERTPLVSMRGAWLREVFRARGRAPLAAPWLAGRAGPAFAFTHDVDYPEMIRWIECLRLLRGRGLAALPSIAGVLRGTNHFWTFREWVDFEAEFGARPTFYFMARRGSLLQYALGTPDDFYDVRSARFARLFAELRDAGAEIGLHASYHAHRSADQLRRERERLAAAAEVPVEGNRHHYWHLDPEAPHETLRRHALAGFAYDSSLGFEYYPGFRRGTCHPFRPFHPPERRELDVVQLPPAWMDDHFGRRRARNGVTDPAARAAELVRAAGGAGGVVVVDYHSRGMNADFYPEYGPWLMRFAREHLGADIAFHTAGEVVRGYRAYEAELTRHSREAAAA